MITLENKKVVSIVIDDKTKSFDFIWTTTTEKEAKDILYNACKEIFKNSLTVIFK